MSFWKTLGEISPKAIEDEAARPFRLALVGDVARLRAALLTPKARESEREEAENYLTDFAETPALAQLADFAFVVYASGPEGTLSVRGANSVPVVGSPETVAAGMILQRPDLTVALARRFPLFRAAAATRLINEACRVNASFALLSALPGILPLAGALLPASSVADIVVLTKNQIMLIMRLAAAHGHKPGYTKQVKELLGTIGGALGWRTLARERAGLVPAGIGAALKATIAYSGTFAVGKAAFWFYQTGKTPTQDEIRAMYKAKFQEARKEVRALRKEQ